MRRLARALIVAVVLAVGVTSVAIVAAEPSVSVSINGNDVTEGTTVRTQDNPTVGVTVEANETIDSVELRVDGETVDTFSPDSESFSERITLGLDSGSHDLEVVAQANETTTFEATVVKDSAPPLISYTSPFETPGARTPEDSIELSNASLPLAGTLTDDTGVKTIRVERSYSYEFAGSERTSRAFHTIETPGDSFSQPLLLGEGENDITVRYTDRVGNVRVHEFTLDVSDNTDPVVNLTAPSETGASTARIQGSVRDNVKLDVLKFTTASGTTQLLSSTTAEPDADRLAFDIDREIQLSRGENLVTVTATDIGGNTEREQVTVVQDRSAPPRVTIDRARSRVSDRNLVVRGLVDRADIANVTLVAESVDSGTVVDTAPVYNATETATHVDIDHELALADGLTLIRVSATDAENDTRDRTFVADSASGRLFDNVSTAAATPTPDTGTDATPDDGGEEGTATETEERPESEDGTDTPTARQMETATEATESDDTLGPSVFGPGFTPAVAVLALVALGLLLARRR